MSGLDKVCGREDPWERETKVRRGVGKGRVMNRGRPWEAVEGTEVQEKIHL